MDNEAGCGEEDERFGESARKVGINLNASVTQNEEEKLLWWLALRKKTPVNVEVMPLQLW